MKLIFWRIDDNGNRFLFENIRTPNSFSIQARSLFLKHMRVLGYIHLWNERNGRRRKTPPPKSHTPKFYGGLVCGKHHTTSSFYSLSSKRSGGEKRIIVQNCSLPRHHHSSSSIYPKTRQKQASDSPRKYRLSWRQKIVVHTYSNKKAKWSKVGTHHWFKNRLFLRRHGVCWSFGLERLSSIACKHIFRYFPHFSPLRFFPSTRLQFHDKLHSFNRNYAD